MAVPSIASDAGWGSRSETTGRYGPPERPACHGGLAHRGEVANAPGYDHGNGHSYFRDSPLVSSDILATLRYNLGPAKRGLIQNPDSGVWEFPADYLARLESVIYQVDPELGRRAKQLAGRTGEGR